MGLEDMASSKKNARRRKAWIVFQDESGLSERPPVRRTWAPRGETPVLIHAFNWKKLSICAALAYRWDGSRSRLYFQTRSGSYDSESLMGFLKDLRRHLRGKRAIMIWDGLLSVSTVVDGMAGMIIDGLGLCPRPRGFLGHGSGGRW